MESILTMIAPNDLAKILVGLFLIITVIDWWMNMVQSTTMNICHANDQPREICLMLNPYFIRLAFPNSLAKWTVAGIYAWQVSWQIALAGIFIVWLISVISPIPLSLTIPTINKKIAIVRNLDAQAGQLLEDMVSQWEAIGRKYYRKDLTRRPSGSG